jgi:hypothetical protein
MRARSLITFAVLAVLMAFAVSGCGDDKPSATNEDSATPAVTPGTTGATGSSGDASASAQATYQACLQAAEKIADADKSTTAKHRCDDAYENIKDAVKKTDQLASDARAKCEEAANKIPDSDTKQQALAACDKFH